MSSTNIVVANATIAAAIATAILTANGTFRSASGRGWRIVEGKDANGFYTRATREGWFSDKITTYYHRSEEQMHRVFTQYIITHR